MTIDASAPRVPWGVAALAAQLTLDLTHDAFNAKLDATLARMVWSHPGMNSWYKNSKGRVITTSPWWLVDYWGWTREPKLAEYRLG